MINKLYSHFLFISAAIIWGASFTYQLDIVKRLGAISFTFYTFLFSFIVLFIVTIIKRERLMYRWRDGLLLGLILSGLELFQMLGLKLSGATTASFVTNLGLILIPFFGALIFRHKVKKFHLICLAIASFGLYYFVGDMSLINLGTYYLLISAVYMALYFLISERLEKRAENNPPTLLMQSFLVVTAISFYFLYRDYDSILLLPKYSFETYKELLLQAFAFTLAPYTLIHYASKISRDIDITFFGGIIEPVAGASFAYIILGERIYGEQLIGIYIIALAFIIGVYGLRLRR
jgi:drug/metabolite transporter (DMT)-like permease